MNKKIFGIAFVLAGVLVLMGAGCNNKGSVSPATTPTPTPKTETGTLGEGGDCGPTSEISSSNALTNELRSILNEAGAEVKLTTDLAPDSPTEGMLIFVWKKKPTTKNLENAFKKHGYKIEISGESLMATKGNTTLNISWTEETDCQKISVKITNEPLKLGRKVTTEECAELFAMGPKIDLRYNSLPASYPWTLKFYDKMAVLEKKYGITQDELSKACKTKSIEPGFNEEVEKLEKELDALIK